MSSLYAGMDNLPKCPFCGGYSASSVVTERYTWTVDFNGVPYGASDNEIISGGKRFICDSCGKDVSKYIKVQGRT